MITDQEELTNGLSEEEIVESRRENGRCINCGMKLKRNYETYECWGREERVKVWICPKCG